MMTLLSQLKEIYNVNGELNSAGGQIIYVAQFICYAAAVIIVLYKGAKLMTAAPEGKARAKEEMIHMSIGALILFAIGTFIKIVADIALELN